MKAKQNTATLDERIREAYKCLSLVSLALYANLDRTENKLDPELVLSATELAWEMASETFTNLSDIDLPHPVRQWRDDTEDEDLAAALQEYARGGREILRRAKELKAGKAEVNQTRFRLQGCLHRLHYFLHHPPPFVLRGRSQYALLHFGQTVGASAFFEIHLWPQR